MIKKTILFLSLALSLVACERISKNDVKILYPNWTEGIAISYLTEMVLKDKGYSVELKRLEPGPMYAALSRGDADIYMDAWLPNTHEYYWKRFGDQLEVVGIAYDNGITGLVVPNYVSINSIEELNANKEKFSNGKIFGIAAGSGIHSNTEKAIKEYNLDYHQVSSSETSMLTAAKSAIANNEWVIITGWKPHQMWTMFDLKPLEDPKGIYPKDEIRIISRKGFKTDKPELAEYFSNFQLDDALLGELIQDMSANKDPKIGIKKFYDKHKDMLHSWIKEKPKNKTNN